MGLAIKNLFQNLKKSTFKLQRLEFFLGRLLGRPYQPKRSTSQKLAEKAKKVLAIKNLFQNLKKSTFKLQRPEFFWGRLLGQPYQPKRSTSQKPAKTAKNGLSITNLGKQLDTNTLPKNCVFLVKWLVLSLQLAPANPPLPQSRSLCLSCKPEFQILN